MALHSVKTPEINIALPEKLMLFLAEKARYKVAHGGRGSAKSVSAGRSLITRCMQRQTRWLCAREFQSSIRESVHSLLEGEINELGLGSYFEIMQNEIRGPNGSLIVYTGLHDKSLDSLKSYYGFDGCWLEEGQSASKRSLQYLDPTIRKEGSEIWITMNPENEDDTVYKEFILNNHPDSIVRQVNWYDNPWFPEVLRKQKDHAYATDPDNADWIWGGNIRRISDKQVLKGKIEKRPFEPNKETWDGPYQGIDFGFAQDPVAMVRCWIWEGDLYIEHEAYAEQCEIEDHVALFDSIPNAREFVSRADNSRPEMISYLKRNGYNRVTSCDKWPGCVMDRVTYIKSFHRIIIHPRCKRIDQEGKLWSWKVNRAGDILNELQPGNDHGWDAVGYALEPLIKGRNKSNLIPIDTTPLPIVTKWRKM